MTKTYISITIDISVHDAEAFRLAARYQAIRDGEETDEANSYLDAEQQSLSDCAVMIFDPGMCEGCNIEQSSAEVIEV